MSVRFYLVPIIGSGANRLDGKRPKYFEAMPTVTWHCMTYGLEPVGLIRADVTPAQHSSLIANSDVAAFPLDLTQNPTAGQVTAIKAQLVTLNIPEDWVDTTQTFRQIVRKVAMIFQLSQRFHGLGGGRLFNGQTLDTTFSALPAAMKQTLKDAADSFGWDASSLTATSTLRTILRTIAHQWAGAIQIGGDTL